MDVFQFHFEITSFIDVVKNCYIIPETYDYWKPLLHYFLPRCDQFEIRCWNEETSILEDIKVKVGDTVSSIEIEGFMTVFKGTLSPQVIEY